MQFIATLMSTHTLKVEPFAENLSSHSNSILLLFLHKKICSWVNMAVGIDTRKLDLFFFCFVLFL